MRFTKTIRDAFVASVMNDVPSVDYDEAIQKRATEIAVANMPPEVRAAYDKYPEWIRQSLTRCGNKRIYLPLPGDLDLSDKDHEELKAIQAASYEQDANRKALREKLTAVAYSVATRKALADMLPEFAKYLPNEAEKSRMLPAVANTVAEFVKAGWPKGRTAR